MNNKETLEKAITKAIDGGWLPYFAQFDHSMTKETIGFVVEEGAIRFDVHTKGRVYGVSGYSVAPASVIFSHDFAKALWGDDQLGVNYSDLMPDDSDVFYEGCTEGLGYEMPVWRHHLQQMVIADDPIKYLGENL